MPVAGNPGDRASRISTFAGGGQGLNSQDNAQGAGRLLALFFV